jgi:predicted CopG family antitoxin
MITRDEVCRKRAAIKGDESFSTLFERLLESRNSTLKKLRGCVEFRVGEKEKLLRETREKRAKIMIVLNTDAMIDLWQKSDAGPNNCGATP